MKWRAPEPEVGQKRTWFEVVQRVCQAHKLSRDDAMVYGSRRKLIRMVDEQKRYEWANVSSGTGSPG